MPELSFRVINYCICRGIVGVIYNRQIRHYFSGLDPFEPFDGALVPFLAYLNTHLLRQRSYHVVQGYIYCVQHNKPVAAVSLGAEYCGAVIDRAQIPGNLLDSLKFSIGTVLD